MANKFDASVVQNNNKLVFRNWIFYHCKGNFSFQQYYLSTKSST